MVCERKLEHILDNSIWIVPCETLAAYQIIDGIPKKINDQTVWIINTYNNGYFMGAAYPIIGSVVQQKLSLLGSITPAGDVLISFYDNKNTTTGIGKFVKIEGEYRFLMQMNNIVQQMGVISGVVHWSYMKKITQKSEEYCNLPGLGFSLEQFFGLFGQN